MKAVLAALVLVLVGGAGAYFWTRSGSAGTEVAAEASRVTTAVVSRGDVNFTVSVAGEIGPSEQVSVRPEVNGRISELPVDVGDRISKGGLLFALDDRDLRIEVESREQEIESARIQLDKARITMEQAQRDYERNKELYNLQLLSAQEFEASRQNYESAIRDHDLARNQIERAGNELDLASERLLKTRISAPFDCTVLTRPVSVGQAVSGSGGFNSGTEVLTIADLNSMVINAHVNQADVTHLRAGMTVAVAVDAIPGLDVEGRVERMAPQATIKNNIKGYDTRIALENLDARVQPGMTATLSIPVAAAEDVLTVPLAAVFSEQGERYVFVRNGSEFERRPVTIGVSDFFHAEIRSGISEGDVVALEQPANSNWRIPGGGPAMTRGANARGGATQRITGPQTGRTQTSTALAATNSTPAAAPAAANSGTSSSSGT